MSFLLGLAFAMLSGTEVIGSLLLTARVREKAVCNATNEPSAHVLASSSECKRVAASSWLDVALRDPDSDALNAPQGGPSAPSGNLVRGSEDSLCGRAWKAWLFACLGQCLLREGAVTLFLMKLQELTAGAALQ